MVDLVALKSLNTERWRKAKLTRAGEFLPVAKRLVSAKDKYKWLEAKTGVPWFVIAVIHEREASQDFRCSLAQGDPWNAVSIHDPKGRGPFANFNDAGYDALVNCQPHAGKWKDWSPGGALTLLEQYNGLGYASGPSDLQGNRYPPQPSPYVWSGTDRYASGKYVADHDFRPGVVDKQLGCAGLILAMMELDPSVSFIRMVPPATPPDVAPVPPEAIPAPTNWLVALITAIIAAFKRK